MSPIQTKRPYRFQTEGIAWMHSKSRALLGDEMGLGKTVQAIKGAAQAGCRRVLVICPAIARTNWAREVKMWEPQYQTHVLTRLKEPLPYRQASAPGDIYPPPYFLCVSFEFAVANRQRLSDSTYRWDLVIVDEAHQLRNPWSQRTAAILAGNSICAHTDRLWHLTGTPLSSHPDEIWPMAYEAQITSLSFTKWCQTYCDGYFDGRAFKCTGAKRRMLDDLHQLLTGSGWMLRRLQDEVAVQIPPISYHELPIEPIKLSAQEVAKEWPDYSQQMVQLQAKLDYEEELIRLALGQPNLLDKDKVAILEGLAGSIAALRRYTGLQKVDSVADLLTQELGADEYPKVVIFFVHRSVGEALQTRLSPFGAHLLYGGLTPRRRDEIIQDFQRPEAGARVILVQYQAGATAINLQVAHQVVCVEVPWIGSELAQGVKRCHRIGQKSPVHVRFATLINSYDEVIMNLLRRRAREINHILDGQPRELMQDTPADPNLLKTPAELRRMVLG